MNSSQGTKQNLPMYLPFLRHDNVAPLENKGNLSLKKSKGFRRQNSASNLNLIFGCCIRNG